MTKLEELLHRSLHIANCRLPPCRKLSRLEQLRLHAQLRLRARGAVREVMMEEEQPKRGNVFYLDDYRGKIK